MNSKKQDALYILIMLGYLTAHYYIVWHICYGLGLPHMYGVILFILVFTLGIISILSLISIRFPSRLINWAHYPGNFWMGIFGITVICFLINDLVNFFAENGIFRYYSTIVALSAAAALCVWSALNASFILRIKKMYLGVDDLKTEKFHIAFISDLHINKRTPFKNINVIVDKINGIKPDIIVIGGDLTDTDITETYPLYGFDRLAAKYGIFAVTGNHEYHLGIEKYTEFCEKLGIKLLRNENVNVAGIITIAGINDDYGEKMGIDISDLKAALENVDPKLPLLLVSHKPDPFKEAVKESKGIRVIQLSGHTHAGQIPPMGIIGSTFFRYYYGRRKKEDSIVYITSGAGWWGPQMRLFNMSEIAEIILYRKRK
ncbi:MAG: metallophosphoesterase [Endomicrobia bacterium]|nr:metallophosphoesterase [Endomicrobiia bacterium]